MTKMQVLLEEKKDLKEIPKKQRYSGRPSLEKIFRRVTDKKERNESIHLAHTLHGYTLKRIADHISIHYTTVSNVLKKRQGEKLYFKTPDTSFGQPIPDLLFE